jgi:eukaryotic-like serine/threonine-protein kinase
MQGPRRIGKYAVERALGAGSFATVWLAVDELLETRVAIKVLADNWARQPDVRRRFIDEAKILRRIDHERIVQVYVIDELDDGRPYFVMGWADRGSMQERMADLLRHGKPVPLEQVVHFGVEIATCLGVVHDFGVVHRDVKPSNLLFRSIRSHQRTAAQRAGVSIRDESMLLGDFGLAKDLAVASGFTLAAGTPAYMAPEQAGATVDLDHRADLFSATAVIYELLCGRPAFNADSLSGVRRSRRDELSIPVRELRPDAPDAMVELIRIGLSLKPEQRFESAHELTERLMAALEETAPPVSPGRGTLLSDVPSPPPPVPTGILGRVIDLVDAALAVTTVSEPALRELRARLVAPPAVLVIGESQRTDDSPTPVTSHFASEATPERLALADLVVAPDPAPVRTMARAVVGGPIAIVDPDSAARMIELIGGPRRSSVVASAGIAAIDRLLTGPDLVPVRSRIADEIEALRLDFPSLVEIEALRTDVGARMPLTAAVRAEAERMFLETHPATRLGLPIGTPLEEVRAAAQREVERWRTMINTGRVPFALRPVAGVLERSYNRLWAETLSASALAELSGQ